MGISISDDYVFTDRGGITENRHGVHAAIVDSHGNLLYAVGDPNRVTLARSAAKPAQAIPIVESGAFGIFDFDDADLALMCSSHSSEERHITRAQNILRKTGAHESDLRCGGHQPLSDAVNREWIKADFTPTSVCSNCSGKHAGMIAAAKALGADVTGYDSSAHILQVSVREAIEDVAGLDVGECSWSIDGCNLPAPAFPLCRLARMYAGFAAAETGESLRARSMARVFRAMALNPEYVAGDGRFCTILMDAFGGSLIGKLGADGCYGIGVKESDQTRALGARGGLGIAVKIEDGNIGALYSAVSEVLEQLRLGDQEMRQQLHRFHCPEIQNTVGVVTGKTAHHFRIRRLE